MHYWTKSGVCSLLCAQVIPQGTKLGRYWLFTLRRIDVFKNNVHVIGKAKYTYNIASIYRNVVSPQKAIQNRTHRN